MSTSKMPIQIVEWKCDYARFGFHQVSSHTPTTTPNLWVHPVSYPTMLSHLPLILLVVATLTYPTVALPNHQAVFSEQPTTSTSLSTALVPVPVPVNEGWVDPRINGGQFLDVSLQKKI